MRFDFPILACGGSAGMDSNDSMSMSLTFEMSKLHPHGSMSALAHGSQAVSHSRSLDLRIVVSETVSSLVCLARRL